MTEDLVALARRGPHRVGVVTLEVRDPDEPGRTLATDVWYPAAGAVDPADSAEHPLNRTHRAGEGLAPRTGAFPLVAFSHGNSGLRRQSTFLTTHLASLGMVVVAPDHSGNTFFEMLQVGSEDERQRVHFDARRRRPRDMLAAIEAVLEEDRRWARVDAERIGVLGHSYGGWTSFKLPGRDGRVRGVCGLAPASEPFVGRKAFEPGELPLRDNVPSLIVAGIDDVLVDLETSVLPLYARLAAPRALVGIGGCDHFHFCDGVELLHGLHEKNPRPRQPRPTRPYAQSLPEETTHRLICAVVAAFFSALFAGSEDPCAGLTEESLGALDGALRRIEPEPGHTVDLW